MRCNEADVFTQIVLTIFRVNGRLLESGDKLVQPLNLTSARWQVMGAIALADKPLTAPQIASAMGVTRQGVQKQVNALVLEGLLAQLPNPGNKRSPFITHSNIGIQVYARVETLQADWANKLSTGLSGSDLQVTLRTLETVHKSLVDNFGG